jgi:hypothetical protein
MKHSFVAAAVLAAAIPLFSVVPAADAAGPSTKRTTRGELVHRIVMKWGNHVQEAYRADVRRWAKDLGPVFATASMDSLLKAAQATSFDAMNDALLIDRDGNTADGRLTIGNTNTVLASANKALGDPATDLVYVPVTPCRIIDTRVAGGVIAANTTRDFDITSNPNYSGQGGDSSNCNGVGAVGSFAAAVINFTVVTPSAAGYITAFPFQATQPLAATVNYTAGDIRGNLAIVKLDQGPAASELSVYTFAQTHLVADIVGYFTAPDPSLKCVNTSVNSFTIAANSANFFNNPTCPTGYTATTPYCWTASIDVSSQGSGYNANAVGNSTFCAWRNASPSSQTVVGGNVCCRI